MTSADRRRWRRQWRWRRRRRLLLFSAPVAVVLLIAIVKAWSVVIAGGAAASDFATGDTGALRDDVAALSVFNVVEPDKAFFAAGSLAVLEGRLTDADRQFSAALTAAEPARSCPARVNLEFVRETMGDRAAGVFQSESAVTWYQNALAVVDGAPDGCFGGSTDPDEQRRSLLEGAAARLRDKIAAVLAAAPPPQGAAPPPPPPAASGSGPGSETTPPDGQLRLNPGSGDPLDRLRQILRDAASGGVGAPG